jgi:hypothetical protein
MRKGDVWLINLDPTIGAEIKKTRPAIIVSEDSPLTATLHYITYSFLHTIQLSIDTFRVLVLSWPHLAVNGLVLRACVHASSSVPVSHLSVKF